jgi:hypothetical protein
LIIKVLRINAQRLFIIVEQGTNLPLLLFCFILLASLNKFVWYVMPGWIQAVSMRMFHMVYVDRICLLYAAKSFGWYLIEWFSFPLLDPFLQSLHILMLYLLNLQVLWLHRGLGHIRLQIRLS